MPDVDETRGLKTKTVYTYHPDTGERQDDTVVHESPREPDVFLPPPNSTEVTPPDPGPQEVAVFTPETDSWEVAIDLRGTVYFDTVGNRFEIENIGEDLPEDALDEPPEPTPPDVQVITRVQLSLFLNSVGFVGGLKNEAIATAAAAAGPEAQILFDDATTFEITDTLIVSLASALQIASTPEELQAAFNAARDLRP